VGKLEERGHLEDIDVNGRILLKCIFKDKNEGMDWIYGASFATR
jgi:hypothetical protein